MKTKAKPILFSAEMVRAILAGVKTQTRRVVNPQPPADWPVTSVVPGVRDDGANRVLFLNGDRVVHEVPQRWQRGDVLYVKETFRVWRKHGSLYTGRLSNMDEGWKRELKEGVEFRSNSCPNVEEGKWRPSIFMPPWLSRLSLTVKSVRIERLQDISEEDARAEGIESTGGGRYWLGSAHRVKGTRKVHDLASLAYADLWNAINGPGAWEANPWVWVVGFEVGKGE